MGLLQQALTGPGRAFAGVPVTTTGYVRQEPDSRIAKGKILVQYTNDQEDEDGERLGCTQEAIYKLWFEENMISQHTWPAVGDQLAAANSKAKLRRRQQCASSATLTSTPNQPTQIVLHTESVVPLPVSAPSAISSSGTGGIEFLSSGSILPYISASPTVPHASGTYATNAPSVVTPNPDQLY